jgi:hypothetical protein
MTRGRFSKGFKRTTNYEQMAASLLHTVSSPMLHRDVLRAWSSIPSEDRRERMTPALADACRLLGWKYKVDASSRVETWQDFDLTAEILDERWDGRTPNLSNRTEVLDYLRHTLALEAVMALQSYIERVKTTEAMFEGA